MTEEEKKIASLEKEVKKLKEELAEKTFKLESSYSGISREEGINSDLRKRLKLALTDITPELRDKILELHHMLSEITYNTRIKDL
jgi:predicted  nucleic acid-binding Zn-ribbon protein